ncbi:MAP kinase kinase kinase SSK2 [Orchesella cincta]|uniref:MAP kinase kinase kinase SSK2 n=1 Tax=Orchesella cincta TaxID=48709 RepID=A0A1D2MYZ6_ORCCI|nr:MAP kinase kinase kinase SSK2 [Orchesella cincta]
MEFLRCYNNYYNVKSSLIWGKAAVLLVVVGVLVQTSVCSLPLAKPCGDFECQALEYCRQHDQTCQPCRDICDSGKNNYDSNRCELDCQDHIHDERYLRLQNSTLLEIQRAELEAKYKDLEKDVLILKILVAVCIAVIAVVVACLTAFLVYFWKLMHPPQGENLEKKKAAVANKPAELPTVYNNRYGVTTPTPETSPSSVTTYNNNSSVSVSPADTNITTVTSTSTHYPPRSSPTKSESSVATPNTMSTNLSTLKNGQSYGDMIGNGGMRGSIPNTNRFRREPSESTLPENCAYDNLSMSPQHYSHHV